jgi:hypothetical protein
MKPARRTTKVVVVTSVMLSFISFWLVVPSSNILEAIALTAAQLNSAEVIEGPSPVLPPERQAEHFRKAWVKLRDKPMHQVCFRIIDPDGSTHDFSVE